MTARIRRALEEPDGDNPEISTGDAIVTALIARAKGGDIAAFKILIERADGREAAAPTMSMAEILDDLGDDGMGE